MARLPTYIRPTWGAQHAVNLIVKHVEPGSIWCHTATIMREHFSTNKRLRSLRESWCEWVWDQRLGHSWRGYLQCEGELKSKKDVERCSRLSTQFAVASICSSDSGRTFGSICALNVAISTGRGTLEFGATSALTVSFFVCQTPEWSHWLENQVWLNGSSFHPPLCQGVKWIEPQLRNKQPKQITDRQGWRVVEKKKCPTRLKVRAAISNSQHASN